MTPDDVKMKFMAADPEQYRDELKIAPSGQLEDGPRVLTPEEAAGQIGRYAMGAIDTILKDLPFEAKTAVLLNLLVTYVGQEPSAVTHRGKVINGITEEVRKRLQKYLPLNAGG